MEELVFWLTGITAPNFQLQPRGQLGVTARSAGANSDEFNSFVALGGQSGSLLSLSPGGAARSGYPSLTTNCKLETAGVL